MVSNIDCPILLEDDYSCDHFFKTSMAHNLVNRRYFLLQSLSLALALQSSRLAFADTGFRQWVLKFKQIACASGIQPQTFDLAFKTVSTIDPEVLQKATYQPEFNAEPWAYFDNHIQEDAIYEGRKLAIKWQKYLKAIESRYGVQSSILLAIWSLETNFGAVLSRSDVMRDVIRSLATLAYADKRRAKYARAQLIAAMRLLQSGDIDRKHLQGSWAGALGHTQFIPTSYLKYGVDFDNDGHRDILNSIPDALASSANLLAKNGWQKGRTWFYEVSLPDHPLPSNSHRIEYWQSLGIRRTNGSAFLNPQELALLKQPGGSKGPAFLVTHNFFVLKRYNNSDRYAFAVGLLADRISGNPAPVRDWYRPFQGVSFKERKEIQLRLQKLGYYSGRIDGKIGSASRKAIETFQLRHHMPINGYPSRQLFNILTENF